MDDGFPILRACSPPKGHMHGGVESACASAMWPAKCQSTKQPIGNMQ